MNKKIVYTVVAIVALGATGAGLYFSGVLNDAEVDPNAPPPADERAYIYVPLKSVVMSFIERKKRRYVQLSLQMVTRDPTTADLLKKNEPMLMAQALTIASDIGIEGLRNNDGKTALVKKLQESSPQLPVFADKDLELEQVIITGFVEQ
jgi:flagellar protein FliL